MLKSAVSAAVVASSSLMAVGAVEARPFFFMTGGLLTATTGSIATNTPFTLSVIGNESPLNPPADDPTPSLTFGFGSSSFTAPIRFTPTGSNFTIIQASTLPGGFGDLTASFAVFDRFVFSGGSGGGLLATRLGGQSGTVSFSGTVGNAFSTASGNFILGSVPETSTWAMMMLGIGAVGFVLRRRQNVTTRVHFA